MPGIVGHCSVSPTSRPGALNAMVDAIRHEPWYRLDAGESSHGSFACVHHGLFDHSEARDALLNWAGLETVEEFDYAELQEREINRLADCIEQYLDLEKTFAPLAINVF